MIQNFKVYGMMCAACASHVENAVSKVEGVQSVSVSLLTSAMRVEGEITPEAVEAAVRRAGYTAKAVSGTAVLSLEKAEKTSKKPLFYSLLFAVLLMVLSMGHTVFDMPSFLCPDENPLAWLLCQVPFAIAVAAINYRYFTGGLRSLLSLRPNMDSLIAVGAGASLLYAFGILFVTLFSPGTVSVTKADFSASAMILSLVTLGKTLEGGAKDRTVGAIAKLSKLVPDTVTVKRGESEAEVPLSFLTTEDTVLLKVGDRIPADCEIKAGHLTVDEAALTGESLPQEKAVGDKILSGTVVTDGFAEAKPVAVGEDTALSATVRMVSEASASKAPIGRLADRVSLYFVPSVMGVSLLTFLIFLLTGQGVGAAIERAVSVLVISCPCALGLATPTAMTVAMGRGAEVGILVKDAETMENLGRIKTVAFDKTGTLTKGALQVVDVWTADADKESVLSLAAALEASSCHPIANAVKEAAKGLPLPTLQDFKTIPGKGLFGKSENGRYMIGNLSLMEDCEVEIDKADAFLAAANARGCGVLFLASQEGLLGAITVFDTLKEDAKEAVSQLKDMGIASRLLSGDCQAVANAVAEEVGIERVFAPLLPDEKGKVITEEREKAHIAMVGDGINDAPALFAADVGIAMGAGTDIALESAGAVLRFDKPTHVVSLLKLGRLTMKKIKQNLFFALVYNVICIPLAAGVFLPLGGSVTPMIAAAAMACSSLTVVTNALSIKRFCP